MRKFIINSSVLMTIALIPLAMWGFYELFASDTVPGVIKVIVISVFFTAILGLGILLDFVYFDMFMLRYLALKRKSSPDYSGINPDYRDPLIALKYGDPDKIFDRHNN